MLNFHATYLEKWRMILFFLSGLRVLRVAKTILQWTHPYNRVQKVLIAAILNEP